ncbi:MAG: CBS domain-containing protein, partial [Gemmatimonadota bacterium]
RHRVSAVLVRRPDGSLAGIFTERDVLLRIVDEPATWGRPVDEFMTPDPQVLTPEAPVSRALELMNAGHYRNVPVVTADGRVVGNLSQHALIRCLTDRFPRQTYNLPPEALRVARTREGA